MNNNDKKTMVLHKLKSSKQFDDAILSAKNYIALHMNEYEDGESIVIEYDGGEADAIVKINGDSVELFVNYNKSNSIRVVECDEEPQDKSVLWITEGDENEYDSEHDTLLQLKALKDEISSLKDKVDEHDYALTYTLTGGDFLLNSRKYKMENESETEKPEDSIDFTDYDENDTVPVNFDIYVGNTSLNKYETLYKGSKYYLKVRFFNASANLVNPENFSDDTYVHIWIPSEDSFVSFNDDYGYVSSSASGFTTLHAEMYMGDNLLVKHDYPLAFDYNEKPNYGLYAEPNAPHISIKTASTYEYLMENINYLEKYELVWCQSDNGLYIKAETANGLVGLFKINGNSETEIEDTNNLTVSVNDGILTIDGDGVYVDENGILIADNEKIYVKDEILIIE